MNSDSTYTGIELFPTLIWKISLNGTLTDKVYDRLKSSLDDTKNNSLGNLTSSNSYVLNHPDLKEFKEQLTTHTNNYFSYTQHPPDNMELYITQSWTNLTKKDRYHSSHSHANSLVSGVFYLEATEQDNITFKHPWKLNFQQLAVSTTTIDKYNALIWQVPIYRNDLILFPSTMRHGVEVKKHQGDRISLAFNSFFKGTIGCEPSLSELTI